MSFRLYNSGHVLVFVNTEHRVNKTGDIQFRFEKLPRNKTWYEYDNLAAPILYSVYFDNPERDLILDTPYTLFQKEDGTSFASDAELIAHLDNVISLLDVAIQDQFTPILSSYFLKSISNFTISVDTTASTVDTLVYDFEATAGHGITIGDEILLLDIVGDLSFFATVLNVSVNTITIDRPIDNEFPAATALGRIVTSEMAVDGSVTPQIFTVRSGAIADDITRSLLTMLDTNAMDDSKFGGQGALTRGLLLRVFNGSHRTVFNFKSNQDIKQFSYDVNYSSKSAAGQHGLSSRITFAGPEKHGVTIRLVGVDVAQWIVQDDLTGLLSLKTSVGGHEVE